MPPPCARLQGVEWETAWQRGLGARVARVVAWVVAETPSGSGGGESEGGGAFNKRQQFRKMPEVCKFIAGNVIYQIRCRHSPTRRSRQRSQRQRQRRQRSSWQRTLRRCLDQC